MVLQAVTGHKVRNAGFLTVYAVLTTGLLPVWCGIVLPIYLFYRVQLG